MSKKTMYGSTGRKAITKFCNVSVDLKRATELTARLRFEGVAGV
jgi:hypothetical protein